MGRKAHQTSTHVMNLAGVKKPQHEIEPPAALQHRAGAAMVGYVCAGEQAKQNIESTVSLGKGDQHNHDLSMRLVPGRRLIHLGSFIVPPFQ